MSSPRSARRRRQPVVSFEALSHGFSHHGLRFVPSSWTTTQNSLPVVDQPSGWAFPCPLSSFGEFHTFALPSPRASLGASRVALCRIADLQSAERGSWLEASDSPTPCGLQIRDTAESNSALRRQGRYTHTKQSLRLSQQLLQLQPTFLLSKQPDRPQGQQGLHSAFFR